MYFDLCYLKNICFDLNYFLINVLWVFLFKCSKIVFGTAMGFGDSDRMYWQLGEMCK